METRIWNHNNGRAYEEFDVLYDNGRYLVIRNRETGLISFGGADCFNSFYGFPVNQSCLATDEALKELDRWIEIDKSPEFQKYHDLCKKAYGITPIDQWNQMKSAIKTHC